MLTRDEFADLLQTDDDRFRRRVERDIDPTEYDANRLAAFTEQSVEAHIPETLIESLGRRERALVRRIRVFDEASLAVTLTGPAYADNPVRYVNRTFTDLTGYTLEDVRDENLRLLQGPDTREDPVADLREALSTWSRVTVTLTNYRADGTPFENRVSIVPVTDRSGSVVNWIGLQAAVGD